MNLGLFFSAFTTMFVIMDPPGNMPIFMGLTSRATPKVRRKIAWQSNAIAFTVLVLFGFFGFQLLNWMNVSMPAMQMSGGLLLLLVALQLLTGKEEDPGDGGGSLHVAVVPLGTPLLAGPGGIVAFMLLIREADSDPVSIILVVLALALVLLVSWLSMRFAGPIMRVLGESGVMLLTRLSGMLLAAIATQLIINGVLAVIAQA
ncbi:MAG: MarC family protein [Trueperella sp.]|nr:MarC family protein [Trueperella sp.]